MRVRWTILALGLTAAVAVMAATAGARVAAPQSKTTTITFWDAYSSDGPEVKRLEKVLIPTFEKEHPGIKVKDVTIPYDSLHQKLITAVAGSQLPDLVRSDIIWVPELANLGVLQPLDTTMPDFKSISTKVFAGPLATNFWKGHYYGLPLDTNTRILVYNPVALQAAGVAAPPKTFAQLQSDSVTAQRQRASPVRRIRHELGGTSALDLVERRQHHERHVHEGDRLPELGEERRRRADARRPLQGRADARTSSSTHGGLGTYDGLPRRSTRRCSTARGRTRSRRLSTQVRGERPFPLGRAAASASSAARTSS